MARRFAASRSMVLIGMALAAVPCAVGQRSVPTQGPRFLLAAWTPEHASDASSAPVLQTKVTLELGNATIDQALKEIIRQTDLEISYSSRIVPLERRVSVHGRGITLAAALAEVLSGLPVDVSLTEAGGLALVRGPRAAPVPADSGAVSGQVTDSATGAPIVGATVIVEGTRQSAVTDAGGRYRIGGLAVGGYVVRARYIGYRPSSMSVTVGAGEGPTADFVLPRSTQELEQVVVTGTIVPTEVKALPSPITIVTSEDLERENLQRIDQIFRGTVPSAVAWDKGQNDYLSTIAVRGTTSLATVPMIKTYIDGVEVADPVMLATIDPASVERIEVTRGPQASTVYGSDAQGGVMQVFTKRGAFGSRPQVSLRAEGGVMDGRFSEGAPFRQEYGLGVSGGGAEFRYNVGATYTNVGEWAPGYYSRTPSVFAGGEWTQGRLMLSLSARWTSKNFSTVNSPFLSDLTFFSRPAYNATEVDQRTFALTTTYRVTPHWSHALTLGQDQSDYDFYITQPRLTTPADTFLQRGAQHMSRVSVRYHTAYDWRPVPAIAATVTAGAEYYDGLAGSSFTFNATRTSDVLDGTTFAVRNTRTNSGYFGQVQVGIREALFLTGGLRGEHNSDFGDNYGTAWSPRVGLSYVRPLGGLLVKVRGSYGNALRAPAPALKGANQDAFTNQLANPTLGPERQHGWDAGLEANWGAALFLGVTYYRQLADDLIDAVTLDPSASPVVTQHQNVGQIKNEGWELEGRAQLWRMGIQASYSRLRSTVQRVSRTYGGNLRVGDALLGVPRDVAGVTVSYSPWSPTSIVLGLSRIGSWTETDNLALWQVYYGGAPYRGSGRDYWITYPSVTKLKVSIAQRLTPQVTGFVQVDNLGNNQRFEEQNLNIPLGRVVQAGVRAQF